MIQVPEVIKKIISHLAVKYTLFGFVIVVLIMFLDFPNKHIENEIYDNLVIKVLEKRNWIYRTVDLSKYLRNPNMDNNETSQNKTGKNIDKHDSNAPIIFGNDNISPVEKKIILLKLLQIKSNAENHLKVAVYLYIKNYIYIRIASILGVIAAVLLAFITKNGWEQTNRYVLIAFFIVSAHVAYYYSIPNICEFQKNIATNANLYTANTNLENRVLTFILNDKNFKNKKEPVNFIVEIDEEMRKLNVFSLGIDQSKVPLSETSLDPSVFPMGEGTPK